MELFVFYLQTLLYSIIPVVVLPDPTGIFFCFITIIASARGGAGRLQNTLKSRASECLKNKTAESQHAIVYRFRFYRDMPSAHARILRWVRWSITRLVCRWFVLVKGNSAQFLHNERRLFVGA